MLERERNRDCLIELRDELGIEIADVLHEPRPVCDLHLLTERDRSYVEAGGGTFQDDDVRRRPRQSQRGCDRYHDGGP